MRTVFRNYGIKNDNGAGNRRGMRERCLCTNTATPSLFREEWNSFHFDFILGFKLREREDTNVQHNAKIYRRFSTPAIGRQPRSKVEPGEEAGLGGEVGNPCLVQD